jgi:hypothetical protein
MSTSQSNQNLFVKIEDDHAVFGTQHDSHMNSTKKQKSRKPNIPFSNGPTNREQFQKLFLMMGQMQNYINMLENRLKQVEQDNTNHKAIIGLSNIAPNMNPHSVSNQQLSQLYNDKLQNFTSCMQ